MDGYLQPCSERLRVSYPRSRWDLPGRGGIAGTYVGRHGLHALAEKAVTITAGTFAEEVEDVLANDDHAVVLARHRFTRDGSPKEYRTAHVYEIRAGKLARCYEQPRDPAAFNEAWGPAQSRSRPQGA